MGKSSVALAADKVSAITGFHKDHVTEILQAAFRIFGDILIEDGEFRIRGLATFRLRIRPEHTFINRMRSFKPQHRPETVYVKTEISPIVGKRVNMLYNEEDTTYKEKLRKKLGKVYEKAVHAENIRKLRAERKKQYREQFLENRNEASGRILLQSLRVAMPDATEEEIQKALQKSLDYMVPAEKEAESAEDRAREARYLAVQKHYRDWLANYASKNHARNHGRKKETIDSYSEKPETGV